jgi:hypothetical protein
MRINAATSKPGTDNAFALGIRRISPAFGKWSRPPRRLPWIFAGFPALALINVSLGRHRSYATTTQHRRPMVICPVYAFAPH